MTILGWTERSFWRSTPHKIHFQLDIHRRANDEEEIEKMKKSAEKASAPKANLRDVMI